MISLTPSHIIEYLFCPRFTYFEYVLGIPQHEEKSYKVLKGREIHDEKLERNKGYLRKRIGAIDKHIDQYLTNEWMRGRIDEVLQLNDGTMAPLDYKFAEYKDRVFETYQTQQYCYACLIEENFGNRVDRGYIVYVRSRHQLVEVKISGQDKDLVKESADSICRIIETNCFPKATRYKKRCIDCTYRNICIK